MQFQTYKYNECIPTLGDLKKYACQNLKNKYEASNANIAKWSFNNGTTEIY